MGGQMHGHRASAMQLTTLFLGALVTSASALGTQQKLKLDDNQIVYIENQPVLGGGVGEGGLGKCMDIAPQLCQPCRPSSEGVRHWHQSNILFAWPLQQVLRAFPSDRLVPDRFTAKHLRCLLPSSGSSLWLLPELYD